MFMAFLRGTLIVAIFKYKMDWFSWENPGEQLCQIDHPRVTTNNDCSTGGNLVAGEQCSTTTAAVVHVYPRAK